MNKKEIKKLAENPNFISGIYNYCDRWCERCVFTQRCMTYAMCEKEDNPQSKNINNKAFWDKIGEIFKVTLEMVKEDAEKMGIDLNAIDSEKAEEYEKKVHKFSQEQPYSKAAMDYSKTVRSWFDSNENLLKEKADELLMLIEADIAAAKPVDEAVSIKDCLEMIQWYQYQIYVKLCRAASGMFHDKEFNDIDYSSEDASGSAKVAIIGIERSIAAWGGLLNKFPQQEDVILDILVKLKRLLRQVDVAFPDARSFVRPGFDTAK